MRADLDARVDLDVLWQPVELDCLIAKGSLDDLERVSPDTETAENGTFLYFGKLKIPLTEAEEIALTERLAAYREEVGTFYGFVGRLLTGEAAHV